MQAQPSYLAQAQQAQQALPQLQQSTRVQGSQRQREEQGC